MQRCRAWLRTISRAAQVFAYKSGPYCVCQVDTPLWPRARPLLRDLPSVPAAWPTTSWHGQAKQPMMLRGQSVSAGVSDAQIPSTWSSVGAKGAVAVVWPQSMLPGSSPWLCGKPVWWAPRHGGVAGPGQVRVCAAGIGRLGSELASLKPMQRRRGGALAPRRTSTIPGRKPEVAPPVDPRARDQYRTAQVVRVIHRCTEAS